MWTKLQKKLFTTSHSSLLKLLGTQELKNVKSTIPFLLSYHIVETDVELSNIGAFKTWPGDLSTEYMELSAKIAEKKLLLLRTSVEKAYNVCAHLGGTCLTNLKQDYVVTTIRSAIHEIEATNQNEKIKLDNLRAEETKYQDQLAELNRRNEDAARKVALYENAELEDAMQERIQLAMARKEKVLHAELREKIGL